MTPRIILDTTLKELYGLDAESHGEIYFIYQFPTSQTQLTKGIPISKKYAYQDCLGHDDIDIQARLFAQVIPQWFGMISGKMNLAMFELHASDGSNNNHAQVDTAEVLAQISEDQRPMVTYVQNAHDVKLPPGAVLAVSIPMDCLEHLPAAVPPGY
ncbi:mitochondrial-processing peptidase subunit alpha protein [Purpureocillium lavendulum]|uniref:Mitochondrial-processing peptidase subunit alpha protein n=1 Tax=Purpureocillium lavendulum TaxID=1247861 RepID=A0AB34FDS1_9HYPO|nr:mitochondrial-processing peptidase subunit alpha protein [Purpureocillium lavendulum]